MEINGMTAGALPLPNQLPAVPQGLPAAPQAGGQQSAASIKKAAQDFEAIFMGMMLKSMRDTVGKDKLTGGGHGEETFRSLLDQEYAQNAAKSGGVGLAKLIEKELTRKQPPAPAAPPGGSHAD